MYTPKFTSEENRVISSCRSFNIVNTAILMNPTNYKIITNDVIQDGHFHKGGICHGLTQKVIPATGDYFCCAGIATCFGIVADFNTYGGFPVDGSSQVIYNHFDAFKKVYKFLPGVHYEVGPNIHQGYITQAGINLFTEVGKLKGAVYSVKKPGYSGHIGIIMGVEWEKVAPPINKWRAWMYTIEFNTRNGTPNKDLAYLQNKNQFIIQQLRTDPVNYYDVEQKKKNPRYVNPNESAGDERTGGKLAFRARLLGGLWFADTEIENLKIASTEHFRGGSYAPLGLLNPDNKYDFFGMDPFNVYKDRLWKSWGYLKNVIYEP